MCIRDRYKTGTINKIIKVAVIIPPIIVTQIGDHILEWMIVKGINPRMVVKVVNTTGTNLRSLPVFIASSLFIPLARSKLILSTIKIESLTTIPLRLMKPIKANNEKDHPVKYKEIKDPLTANGIAEKTMNG